MQCMLVIMRINAIRKYTEHGYYFTLMSLGNGGGGGIALQRCIEWSNFSVFEKV